MRKFGIALIALAAMVFAGSPITLAEQNAPTMDAIYLPVGRLALAAPVGFRSQRSAVAFPHSRHFEYACRTCHHQWDGQSAVRSCSAANCHDQLSAPPRKKIRRDQAGDTDAVRYFKFAFHRQCIGCHKAIKVHNDKLTQSVFSLSTPLAANGPTGCVGCHPRE